MKKEKGLLKMIVDVGLYALIHPIQFIKTSFIKDKELKRPEIQDKELRRPETQDKLKEMKEVETDKMRRAAIAVLSEPEADAYRILEMEEVIAIRNEDEDFDKLANTISIIRSELEI